MVVCLFDQVAWNKNVSDVKRPEMINSADQKSCRVVSCIKAKAGSSVVKRPLVCQCSHCTSGDANVKYSNFIPTQVGSYWINSASIVSIQDPTRLNISGLPGSISLYRPPAYSTPSDAFSKRLHLLNFITIMIHRALIFCK